MDSNKETKEIYIVNFSGGKDSTYMLFNLIEKGYPIDFIVMAETGVEYPEIIEHTKLVARKLSKYGYHIIIVKNPCDMICYMTKYKRKKGKQIGEPLGFPSIKSRWCTSNLKNNVIKRFRKEISSMYEDVVFIDYIGYSYDEQDRAERLLKNETPKQKYLFPLIEWKITEQEALQWCLNNGFTWNGLYNYMTRVSCYMCPLQNNDDIKYLITQRPELWNKIKEIEQQLKSKGVKQWKFKPNYSTTELEEKLKP